MPPKFVALYRIAPDRPSKQRPSYYSQEACLRSFLRAWSGVPSGDALREIHFVLDGPVDSRLVELCASTGEIHRLEVHSNPLSFRYCVDLALSQNSVDYLYFAEDDYVYTQDAFSHLIGAATLSTDAEYFTLYDHPDRYMREDDLDRSRHRLTWVAGHHWVTVESSCLTFAARAEAFSRDSWMFRIATAKSPPWDRALWRAVLHHRLYRLIGWGLTGDVRLTKQGVRASSVLKYALGRRPRLLSALPALATHAVVGGEALGVDWKQAVGGQVSPCITSPDA